MTRARDLADSADKDIAGTVVLDDIALSNDISIADGGKAIFGDGSDLQIYHDGAKSYINDIGTGEIVMRTNRFIIQDVTGTETLARFDQNSFGKLYHDDSQKLVTTSTGVDVTGTVKADSYENDAALPTVRPSLLLDFANSKTLDPRITFTRGSTATYWDGKTTTKAEENLYQPSQGSTPYQNSSRADITSGQTAPDGTSTAIKMSQNAAFDGGSGGYIGYLQSPINSGKTATFSFYAKADTSNWIRLRHIDYTSSGGEAWFNLSTGVVGTVDSNITATITSVGNSWYRVTSTYTTPSSGSVYALLYIANADQGTTANTDDGFFVWGGQLEERSSVTAYTPTINAPVVKYQPTLQTAASGEARFDHDPLTGESKGLLIEEARTNLIYPSVIGTSWNNPTTMCTANAAIAPDGTNTATLINESITARQQLVSKLGSAVVSGADYIFSIYVKANTWSGNVQIHAFGDGNQVFNLSAADYASATNGMYSVGNGWKRIWWKNTKTNTNASFYIGFSGASYAGQGYAKSFFTWGAQLEAGSFPTSYIPTSGSAVTRSSDFSQMDDVSWYNNEQGTMYAKFTPADTGTFQTAFRIGGTTDDNVVYLRVNATNEKEMQAYSIGSKIADIEAASSAYISGAEITGAGAFANNDWAVAYEGTLVGTDTAGSVPVGVTEAQFGVNPTGSTNINGTIKKIAYYPKRLSNATLQAMTEE